MAYTSDKKSTGLDVLTGLDSGDLHIVGDISDSGRAKAITQNNLEIDIANSNNFVDTLVANNYFTTELAGDTNFITNLQTSGIGSTVDVQENGVSVENPVDTINFIAPSGTVTTPSAGVVDIDLTSLIGGGTGSGGTKLAIDTTETSATSTTPVTAYSIAIPGGTLGTNDAIRFKLILKYSYTGGSPNGNVTIKYGGQDLVTNYALGGGANQQVEFDGVIIANGATNAQKAQLIQFGNVNALETYPQYVALTVDSTTSQNIEVITKLASAGSGSSVDAKAIIVEKITDTGIQTKTVSISSSEIKTLNASPKELIAAPGAGKAIIPMGITYSFTYGTTQYTAGNNIRTSFSTTTGAALDAGIGGAQITAAANSITNCAQPFGNDDNIVENDSIILRNIGTEYATGD